MAPWRLHSLVIIFKCSRCFDYNYLYILHLERLLFRQTHLIFVFRFLVGSICLLRFPRPVRATVTFHPPCRFNLLKCDILLTLNAFHCQCQGWICRLSKIWDSQKMSVQEILQMPHWQVFQFSFFIFKVNPHPTEVICTIFYLRDTEYYRWIHSTPFDITCWIGDYTMSGVQCRLFPSLSVRDLLTSKIGSAQLFLPVLLIFWHYGIRPFFSVIVIPTKSAVSGPWGRMENSKPLHLRGNFRHLVPHGQFVTMWNARGCPWGWPVVIALPDTQREKKKEVKGEKESVVERDWTWQRPWNRSVPLSRAKGVCSEVVSTSH